LEGQVTARSERFRPSAKGVVVVDGRLLVTRNRTPGDPGPDWHIFPGGGQQPGERLEAAVVREVREETGIEVRPRGLLWVREVIFELRARAVPQNPAEHSLEFMFAADFIVDHGDPSEEDQFQVAVEWVRPQDLPTLRFYPQAVVPALVSYLNGGQSGEVYLGDVD
jgi:8-oxo-dGTP pyrophosphatase MutT (NUDIX family)